PTRCRLAGWPLPPECQSRPRATPQWRQRWQSRILLTRWPPAAVPEPDRLARHQTLIGRVVPIIGGCHRAPRGFNAAPFPPVGWHHGPWCDRSDHDSSGDRRGQLTMAVGFGPSLFGNGDRFGLAAQRTAPLVDLPSFAPTPCAQRSAAETWGYRCAPTTR